jgi:hypothetical protein
LLHGFHGAGGYSRFGYHGFRGRLLAGFRYFRR